MGRAHKHFAMIGDQESRPVINPCVEQGARPDANFDRRSVWVVIPAFNEAKVIGSVVADVVAAFPSVVVVDDCSADETAAVALRSGAFVISHPINLGQGAALQTGIRYALARDARYIVTFDADGQHCVEDVGRMLQVMRAKKLEVVLGSRFLGVGADRMPASRKRLLRAAVLFERLTTGAKITDAHNGIRILSREFAKQLQIKCNRMAHASEILSQIVALGARYEEVPVRVSYTEYSVNKGQKGRHAVTIIRDLIAEWFSR